VCSAWLSQVITGGWSTPKPVDSAGEEVTLKVCGVGVAMLSGHELGASLVDRSAVNVGTVRGRSGVPVRQTGRGQVRRRLRAAGRDGGLVVVRGRESRLHGEGDQ
jgi:hypothetical protein